MLSLIKQLVDFRIVFLIFLFSLFSCSETEEILTGKRIAIIDSKVTYNLDVSISDENPEIGIPVVNEIAGHPGINAGHSGGHLSLKLPLKKIWQNKVKGSPENFIKLPQPVVANKLVLAVGYDAIISAFDLETGKNVWGTIIEENPEEIFPGMAGGIATNGELVAVHAARKNLLILDINNGQLKWLLNHNEPLAGGPTFLGDDAVAVTDIDGKIFVYDLDDGTILWQKVGIPEKTVYFGAASPAYNNEEIVLVGSGGDVSVHNKTDGSLIWADNIINSTPISPLEEFGDIVAHPIHDGKDIIIISQSGSLTSYSAQTGFAKWEFKLSSSHMPWVSGKTIYALSDDNFLISIRKADGRIRWKSKIENSVSYLSDSKNIKHVGPIVASDKVIVVSEKGKIFAFDTITGKNETLKSVKGPILISPQLSNNTLITISNNGIISALR